MAANLLEILLRFAIVFFRSAKTTQNRKTFLFFVFFFNVIRVLRGSCLCGKCTITGEKRTNAQVWEEMRRLQRLGTEAIDKETIDEAQAEALRQARMSPFDGLPDKVRSCSGGAGLGSGSCFLPRGFWCTSCPHGHFRYVVVIVLLLRVW